MSLECEWSKKKKKTCWNSQDSLQHYADIPSPTTDKQTYARNPFIVGWLPLGFWFWEAVELLLQKNMHSHVHTYNVWHNCTAFTARDPTWFTSCYRNGREGGRSTADSHMEASSSQHAQWCSSTWRYRSLTPLPCPCPMRIATERTSSSVTVRSQHRRVTTEQSPGLLTPSGTHDFHPLCYSVAECFSPGKKKQTNKQKKTCNTLPLLWRKQII